MSLHFKTGACAAGLAIAAAFVALNSPRGSGDGPPVKLLVFGPTLGFLEPCGCTGGQLGGLARRKPFLDAATQRDRSLVVLDAGELVRGGSLIERTRGEAAAAAYRFLALGAIGVGKHDLQGGLDEAALRASLHGHPSALTNGETKPPLVRSVIAAGAAGTPRVLTLSLMGGDGDKPVDAAKAELAANADKFDAAVAFFYGSREAARALATACPEIDVVVVARGAGAPDEKPEAVGSGVVLHAGERGRYAVRLEGARKSGKFVPSLYKVEAIASDLPLDPMVDELVEGYRDKLEEQDVVMKLAGQLPPPNGGFAGSDACIACHTIEHEIWKGSKHSHGMESLVNEKRRDGKTPRKGHLDPDCLKCHAVGWFNDDGKGYATGYAGDLASPLAAVGCESCHGPARVHTTAPLDKKKRPVREVTCQKCHDEENSPKFDRAIYWPKIAHDKAGKEAWRAIHPDPNAAESHPSAPPADGSKPSKPNR